MGHLDLQEQYRFLKPQMQLMLLKWQKGVSGYRLHNKGTNLTDPANVAGSNTIYTG